MVRQRYRLRFAKKGNLCFIGHRDLLRTIERLICRAKAPVAMSQGFHPKPRVSYLSALPLGFSSDDEAMEIILDEALAPEELLERFNSASVDGLTFLRCVPLGEQNPKQKAVSFSYDMTIPAELRESVAERIEKFLAADVVEVVKANGKTVDARPVVLDLRLVDDRLLMTVAAQDGPEAGVREILEPLGLASQLFRTVFPNRNRSTIEDELNAANPSLT